MSKKKSFKKVKNNSDKKPSWLALPSETKKWIWGIATFSLAIVIALSFFGLAGPAGQAIFQSLTFLIGKTIFSIPLILVFGGLVFLSTKYKKFLGPVVLAILILIIGVAGILESLSPEAKEGGWIGYLINWPFLKIFSRLVAQIIFSGVILIGLLIFWHLLRPLDYLKEQKKTLEQKALAEDKKPSLIKKIFAPKFKVEEIEPLPKPEFSSQSVPRPEKNKGISQKPQISEYKLPPLDLLETEKGVPGAGDTITNSAIIKKTLDNFGLKVEMSGINIGPTVTQYSLKPAEGIKLSKITGLSNNLSLALASHPIRIEAPIPGKPLVGIEVPNKIRCQVRLRDALDNPDFQRSPSYLTITLGKDVAGNFCFADLAKMPHLLVAGSTGTGKTIFLNNLILSLLYQNSPASLRFILIDPKRVEFSAYQDLPHLLCPVIFDSQKSINALRWLVSEMEKRFDILSRNGSRDISSYNQKALKSGEESLPYIVVIIDELADLMAARGREVEAGIVRLAQMARAVGIHLVVATQRPSVEVITGLIKANITSRVTFQVASQVDSRTVLDAAGAEKLLGSGDLLFLSADVGKPKRVQGAYVSEKEVKKVIEYIKTQNAKTTGGLLDQDLGGEITENHLAQDLKQTLEGQTTEFEDFNQDDDPLYEEARRVVIEAKKASASLLQRRLKIGYARAARLIDIMEEKGVVGPGEGAKPREVFLPKVEGEEDGWQKV